MALAAALYCCGVKLNGFWGLESADPTLKKLALRAADGGDFGVHVPFWEAGEVMAENMALSGESIDLAVEGTSCWRSMRSLLLRLCWIS